MKLKHQLWVCAMQRMKEIARWKTHVKTCGLKEVSEKKKQKTKQSENPAEPAFCHNNIQLKIFQNMFPKNILVLRDHYNWL